MFVIIPVSETWCIKRHLALVFPNKSKYFVKKGKETWYKGHICLLNSYTQQTSINHAPMCRLTTGEEFSNE